MRRPRVLVVDDEPGMLRAVARVLGGVHDVTATSSAREALALAERLDPDLAIVDVRMPDMNGFEVTAALKRAVPDVDVILMTGSVSDLDQKLVRALREEAFYFIQKPFDREVLEALVARCLKLRRLEEANRRHTRRLEAELDHARSFQRSMLPPEHGRIGAIALDCRSAPCTELGGDFYDYAEAGGGRAALLVADVSGHGASAAMLTGIVKGAFTAARADRWEPLAVIGRVAAGIGGLGPARFVTAFAARVRDAGSAIEYVSAGHPPALLWGPGRAPRELASTGLLVSPALPGAVRERRVVSLAPGDRLLVYTDGIVEAGTDDEPFGLERLREVVTGGPAGEPGSRLLDRVVDAVRAHVKGRPPQDDWTLALASRDE